MGEERFCWYCGGRLILLGDYRWGFHALCSLRVDDPRDEDANDVSDEVIGTNRTTSG